MRDHAPKPRRQLWLVLLSLLALQVVTSGPARAASRTKSSQAKAQALTKKKAGKHLSRRAAAKARAEAKAKADAEAIAAGKAAVFAFEGDETDPLRRQVIRMLRANGMHVQTDLRPTDTAEQFRDMAATLSLAIYVHGRVRDLPGGRALATITIRSGVTGRTVARADFRGDRRDLAAMMDEALWRRVQRSVAQACVDARKPRRHNAPMRIEAGTPIEDTSRRGS